MASCWPVSKYQTFHPFRLEERLCISQQNEHARVTEREHSSDGLHLRMPLHDTLARYNLSPTCHIGTTCSCYMTLTNLPCHFTLCDDHSEDLGRVAPSAPQYCCVFLLAFLPAKAIANWTRTSPCLPQVPQKEGGLFFCAGYEYMTSDLLVGCLSSVSVLTSFL